MVAVSPPRAVAHEVSPQALSHAGAGVRVSGCPGVPRRGQEAAGGAAGGGGAFGAHPGSGGAAASGLQLEPGSAASAGGDSGVPSAAAGGGGRAGGRDEPGHYWGPPCPQLHRVTRPCPSRGGWHPSCPAQLLWVLLCALPLPPGARGAPGPDVTVRGAPGELARLAAVPVCASPPRWHRGPLAGDGDGRGFPGCWRSSASQGRGGSRVPSPLRTQHIKILSNPRFVSAALHEEVLKLYKRGDKL